MSIGTTAMMALPAIPIVDAREGGAGAAAAALPDRLAALLAAARRRYTRPGLALGDAVSRRWLRRNANPYLPEIEAVAARLGAPGAYALNLSYEWACTTGVHAAEGASTVMLRVLDWALHGLGRNLAVIRRRGPAGEWLDLGWPGFVGTVTALAPGRFAAAINQPPLPATGLGAAADWLAVRGPLWRSRALPPAHLLRRVCDEAADFDAAAAMLMAEPVSAAAFFTLAGPGAGEGCVVERRADGGGAVRRPAAPSVAVANHWIAMPCAGRPRGRASGERQARMEALLERCVCLAPFDLAWLAPPILNDDTRVVAVAEPATGRLALQGFERGGRLATQPLRLDAA